MRALVTGASRGLGLALCQELSARGDEVLATARGAVAALELPGVETLAGIDLAHDDAAQRLRDAIGGRALDVVIANAGVNWTFAAGIEELDVAQLRSEFEVNTFGVVRTIQGALPSMGEGGKIAIISTWRPGVGAARRNYGYQMSKVASNQLQFLLADELADRGIATVTLSPGPMDTELLRAVVDAGHANLTPAQAQDPAAVARDLLARIDELTAAESGAWRFRTGETLDLMTSTVRGH